MGNKKKFFDKKKAATFQLFARDSSDPDYTGTPENDRVFVRVDNNQYFFGQDTLSNNAQVEEGESDSIFADAPEDGDDCGLEYGVGSKPVSSLPDNVRREILELGFPDDGYNYLMHMREIKNTGGGSAYYQNPKATFELLPNDVKAYDASRVRVSQVETEPDDKLIYSVASKTVNARLQKVIDPDVKALLDADDDLSRFGSDVEDLEEDFVLQANVVDENEEVGMDFDKDEEPESSSSRSITENPVMYGHRDLGVMNNIRDQFARAGDHCDDEEPRVRGLIDEQFDRLLLEEYGTDNEDDYDGYMDQETEGSLAEKLKSVLNEDVKEVLGLDNKYEGPADLLLKTEGENNKELVESAAQILRRCAEYGKKYENENEDEEVVFVEESSDEEEKWDCETIVTTYTNLDNHPGKIEAPETRKKKLADTISGVLASNTNLISLRGKERLPVDFLPQKKVSFEKVKDQSGLKTESLKRKPHGQETKEEKKERKAAVKEGRREARRTKKETRELYQFEAHRAQRAAAICGPSGIHLM